MKSYKNIQLINTIGAGNVAFLFVLILLPICSYADPFAGLEQVSKEGVDFLLTKVVGVVGTVFILFTVWGIKAGNKTVSDLMKVVALIAVAASAALITDWIVGMAK